MIGICRFGESFWLSDKGYMVGFEETRCWRLVGKDCTIEVPE